MPVDFSTIETYAKLTETNIQTREICDKWLLLTYDLPHNEKGDAARRRFLVKAHEVGAVQHTASVYLMPWTPAAETLALELARVELGKVCVWSSQTTDKTKAEEITKNYDKGLAPVLYEIGDRLDKIAGHLEANRLKRAMKMMEKTGKMLAAIRQAIIARGSAQLYILLTLIERRAEQLKV